MKKKVVVIVLLIIVLSIIGIYLYNKNNLNSDAIKFKEEYESYNHVTTDDGYTYPTVEVKKTDPIKYSTSDEVISILKDGTGIILFSTPDDPWSRNAIVPLLQASRNYENIKIYYLDISKKQDVYEAKNNKAVKTKDGTEEYYQMVDILKEYLSDYIINNDDDVINTNTKRIYTPTVIFVKDKEVIAFKEGTTSSHVNNGNGYVSLTESEEEELFDYYSEKMEIIDDALKE